MPYRIDVARPPGDALDRLIECGALDVEHLDGGLAAIIPDSVRASAVADALGVARVVVSPAVGRDDGSVWILSPRIVRIGRVEIAPPGVPAGPRAVRLTDSAAFGTGLHPTTALCVEALDDALSGGVPERLLDVGTGTGVLALVALTMGVPRAVGLDIDEGSLAIAAEHAHLNGLADRLRLVLGAPESVGGAWPLVVANILAAPLIEMAPMLVRRVGHQGRLILSGIPVGVAPDVERVYRRLGMRPAGAMVRAGWTAVVLQASW